MSDFQDHPDIEKLPLEINGQPVREVVRMVFRDPQNGTPDSISKAGCLVLARAGHVVWNAWRSYFPVEYPTRKRYVPTNNAVFSGENLAAIDFRHFVFGDYALFLDTRLGVAGDFSGAVFGQNADFTRMSAVAVRFDHCRFDGPANFSEISIEISITFYESNFADKVKFNGSHFGEADFRARFQSDVKFLGCFSDGLMDFSAIENSNLMPCIDFSGSTIRKISFLGRRFTGATTFGQTKEPVAAVRHRQDVDLMESSKDVVEVPQGSPTLFLMPPVFHSCELNQDTSFEGAKFSEATGSEEAVRAYRTLKHTFSKQQAIREEQRFFRLEMEEETLRETGHKRWLFVAYKKFSDYGFSVIRPLTYWVIAILCLTAIYGLLSWMGQCGPSLDGNACVFTPQWLEFSLLQTLPLPGLDKLSEVASKAFWPAGAWWGLALSLLVIVHKTISLAALFLIGLALRNLFKIK
jgi:uncharacterized protein YjbI with pentapeptide repeats